ncbi:MAG TPA: polysaccharide deacetylase family protein [Acidimicrobiales bacterium]|jgi:uncharacterized protein YdaL|nr:polysaccharide deacetylase family protein [Acidimicrobiales bacterium]
MKTPRRGLLVALLVAVLVATLGATPASAAKAPKQPPAPTTPAPSALIVYDTTTEWGFLGEIHATMVANLVGRFGTYKAVPTTRYTAGMIGQHTATIYVGTTYDEPIPQAFLDDVSTSAKPVIWLHQNIWQLGAWTDAFAATNGWRAGFFDFSRTVTNVAYKGRSLTRHPQAGATLDISVDDHTKTQVLATATKSDGSSVPWAIRSGQLTYIGDIPFSYMTESDRYLIFADLLFDALAPATAVRRRALIRIEDVNPVDDPAKLRAIADYLSSEGVPFSVGVSPVYVDPNGEYNGGVGETYRLRDNPAVVSALKYMVSKGGTLLMHGYTHQYSNVANPYNGVTGDDFEFYRAHVNADDYVVLDGPVPEDSQKWAADRITASANEFKAVGLAVPTIFEFPHYAGSVNSYKAVQARGMKRYERALYPRGVLSGTSPDYSRPVGQFFPYPVRDLYGTLVIPENLGNYEPESYNNHPTRFPEEIIANAERNLVVRDGFASFFHHNYLDLEALKTSVRGIKALGYTFVSADSV